MRQWNLQIFLKQDTNDSDHKKEIDKLVLKLRACVYQKVHSGGKRLVTEWDKIHRVHLSLKGIHIQNIENQGQTTR